MTLGEQIAAARKVRGLTQKEVAGRMKVSIQAVSQAERSSNMTTGLLKRIAKAIGVEAADILTWENERVSK